jgi:type II secretory pathway pseudopilin PulG
MSHSTKRTLTIAIILIVLATSVFGVMVYQVRAQGERLTEQIAILAAHNTQKASYDRLEQITNDSQADRAEIQSYFLQKESDSIDFLNHVESLALTGGVALETDSLKDITEKGGTKWIQATFSFSGNRENVENFIRILETLPYVARVTNIEMGAQSSVLWNAVVVMQVQVLSYDTK